MGIGRSGQLGGAIGDFKSSRGNAAGIPGKERIVKRFAQSPGQPLQSARGNSAARLRPR